MTNKHFFLWDIWSPFLFILQRGGQLEQSYTRLVQIHHHHNEFFLSIKARNIILHKVIIPITPKREEVQRFLKLKIIIVVSHCNHLTMKHACIKACLVFIILEQTPRVPERGEQKNVFVLEFKFYAPMAWKYLHNQVLKGSVDNDK